MKRLFSFTTVFALILSLLILPTSAAESEDADILMYVGETTSYAVSWYESPVSINGDLLTVMTTDDSVVALNTGRMEFTSVGATVYYDIMALKPGKTSLLFYRSTTGQLVRTCSCSGERS